MVSVSDTDLDNWIRAQWDKTVRHAPVDDGPVIALARPYTAPCDEGMFQEFFYWDIFYTNLGLIAHGRIEVARDNAECLLGLVDRFGFVPNGNRTWYLSRSQPPHLALIVEAVHAATQDDAWLASALPRVEREMEFWRTRRGKPCGLSTYGSHGDDAAAISTLDWVHVNRFRSDVPPEQKADLGHDLIASCESGWDFTPRFGLDCRSVCPVDLNALLAVSEELIGTWRSHLGLPGAGVWLAAANNRRSIIDALCWDEALGTWLDWDWRASARRPVPSAAAAYVLWLGAGDPNKARRWTTEALQRLLFAGGVTTCEPGMRSINMQWDHPNAWPPLQYATVMGLRRARYETEARRVASAWCDTVLRLWSSSGRLWEKLNAVTAGLDVQDEYPMPSLLDWTAGVWVELHRLGLDKPLESTEAIP